MSYAASKRFRIQTGLVATATVATMAWGLGSAHATLLNYDDFAYAPGNVGNDSSPSGITWNTGSYDTVVSGSLSYPASVGTAPADPASTYDNSLFVPSGQTVPNRIPIQSGDASITANGSSVYYSFLLSVSTSDPNLEPNTFAGPDSSGLQGLIAGLTDGGPGTGNLGTLDNGIYLRAGSTAGTVNFGVGGTRGHSTVEWSGDISAVNPILVVGDYNIITNQGSYTDNVYINPTLGQEPIRPPPPTPGMAVKTAVTTTVASILSTLPMTLAPHPLTPWMNCTWAPPSRT